jgi:mono/diheme cytochrome c family protein
MISQFRGAGLKIRTLVALAAIVLSSGAAEPAPTAQGKAAEGDAAAGRAFALLACTGCHVVAADQPFKPDYVGPPRPRDFKDIAKQPGVTADSLRRYLETLPDVPQNGQMPNLELSSQELRDVIAFILSQRDKSVSPPR